MSFQSVFCQFIKRLRKQTTIMLVQEQSNLVLWMLLHKNRVCPIFVRCLVFYSDKRASFSVCAWNVNRFFCYNHAAMSRKLHSLIGRSYCASFWRKTLWMFTTDSLQTCAWVLLSHLAEGPCGTHSINLCSERAYSKVCLLLFCIASLEAIDNGCLFTTHTQSFIIM